MYTYAFLTTPSRPLDLPQGIIQRVQLIPHQGLAAVVEPALPLDTIQASDEQLVRAVFAHDRVLRQLFEQTSLLPLRFGTQFVSLEKLLAHLTARHQEYQQQLAHLQGQAEYTIKCSPKNLALGVDLSPNLQGREYFLAKKQLYQAQQQQQQQQRAELQAVFEAIAHHYPQQVIAEPKEGVERLYLLLPRQDEPQLEQQLKDWQAQCSSWELSLGEALPPYHFV